MSMYSNINYQEGDYYKVCALLIQLLVDGAKQTLQETSQTGPEFPFQANLNNDCRVHGYSPKPSCSFLFSKN